MCGNIKKTISTALIFIIITIFFVCRENAQNSINNHSNNYSSVATNKDDDYYFKTEDYKSETVYITPTGKRYHLSPTCGGKNSTSASLEDAVNIHLLTPCKKCAQ